MKTFTRANLPKEIKYNKGIYKVSIYLSAVYEIKRESMPKKDIIKVEVLDRRLKNKENIHGVNYKPSVWIYEKINTNL
jgi:hypothetical protein